MNFHVYEYRFPDTAYCWCCGEPQWLGMQCWNCGFFRHYDKPEQNIEIHPVICKKILDPISRTLCYFGFHRVDEDNEIFNYGDTQFTNCKKCECELARNNLTDNQWTLVEHRTIG